MKQSGFTLKESIVAILIIILIAGLLYPVFLIARSRASEAQCRANLAALWTWYSTQQSAGEKVDRVKLQLFLYTHPEGKKIRCPLSGKAYELLPADGQPYVEGPDYILRKNPHILAYCEHHIHPSARERVGYNPNGTTYTIGTGADRWDDPVYLTIYKDGQVKYADVYQVEHRVQSTAQ
jgi:type II secretory pathway pseudopilin PulG